jgi:hypothetical protein
MDHLMSAPRGRQGLVSCHKFHLERPVSEEEFARLMDEVMGVPTTASRLPDQRPLDDVLRTRTHLRLLRTLALLGDPINLTGRDAARNAGVSHARAVAALQELRGLGVLRATRGATWSIYELNPDSPLAPPLRALFEAERDLTPA